MTEVAKKSMLHLLPSKYERCVRSLPVLLLSLGKHGWSLCLAGADKQTQISEQAQNFHKAFREEVSKQATKVLVGGARSDKKVLAQRLILHCLFMAQVKKGVDEQFKRK